VPRCVHNRVYISHDVVFDEGVFPLATLHPNVGAHLRAEISLLPPSLHTLNNVHGNDVVVDHVAHGGDLSLSPMMCRKQVRLEHLQAMMWWPHFLHM
jgi:hypothetical protein